MLPGNGKPYRVILQLIILSVDEIRMVGRTNMYTSSNILHVVHDQCVVYMEGNLKKINLDTL